MQKVMPSSLRVLYAAGPGNVIGTYQHWRQQKDDPSQVSVTYSGQFFEVCRELSANAYVISSHQDSQKIQDAAFTLEHRPIPFRKASGPLYHVGQIWYGLRLAMTAMRFRADVAVVADGTTHWFMLSLLPRLGVQVIPSLHCVLWRKFLPMRRVEKMALNWGRRLFRQDCRAILAISDDIAEQVALLTNQQHPTISIFTPVYRREQFALLAPPDEGRSPFRVLFAGRIEPEKGVFDLLEIAKQTRTLSQNIVFDLCGDGSALEALQQAAAAAGLADSFICHGHCDQAAMRQRYEAAHAVIVPTRTDFVEGFNKVVVEGVLAGRPVVTSAACPALSTVREAVVEVPPNDTAAYAEALVMLMGDRALYQQKQQACLKLQDRFYDPKRGWAARLKTLLLNCKSQNYRASALQTEYRET
jgi:glycogen(starch) synthase